MWHVIADGNLEKVTLEVFQYLGKTSNLSMSIKEAVEKLTSPASPLKDIGTFEEVMERLRECDFTDPSTPSYAKLPHDLELGFTWIINLFGNLKVRYGRLLETLLMPSVS
jgi:hypothetical protein